MSMRFNRFYNKLSKKNNKINLASYDDKLISSVPAEELDLPNGYTISDNKVFYNDTEIGKFSYRNVDEMGSIDLDSINIVDNEPVLDLDGINIPEEDNEPVLDLDGINIPEEDNEPVLDLDGINIVPTKATSVPKTTIDDTELVNEGHVFPSYEIKEEFTTQEQQELLEKIHDVQEALRKSFLEYESNKKDLSEDYVKQIEGYKTRFNDMQEEITFESKSKTEAQLDELIRMKKQVDNSNNRVNMNKDVQKTQEPSKKTTSALDRIKSVKKEDKEQELEKINDNRTVFCLNCGAPQPLSLKKCAMCGEELIKKVNNEGVNIEEKEKLAQEYRTKYYENKGLVAECNKLLKYMDADKKVDFESRKSDYIFRYNLLSSVIPLSISELEARIRMASSDHYKLKEFVKNAQDNKAKSNEKEITGREILEAAKKTEDEEVKAKKASIAKALINDMKDIIVKEAKIKGMNALAFTLKQVSEIKKKQEAKIKLANIKSRKTKTNNILDKINAKREATNVVNEIKDKIAVPANIIPDFLRLTKEDDLADKRRKDIEDSEKALEKARLARENARLEKEEKEKARRLAQAKKEREEAEKQEIINSIKNDSDVDFETLDERIYNKYSIKDLKELDEKYTEKIEKFNSKLDKTNSKIEKTDKKLLEKEVALTLAIESSNTENELLYRSEILELKEKLEELKNKAETLKAKISDKEAIISSIKERFTAESIKVYEENEAEELRIMQEKEDAMNARLEEEAILERDKNRKEISKVFRQDVAKEESALNFKTNNEIKKLLAYTKQLEAEGKDSKEFIKNYAAAIEAERKANDKLKELELAMGIVKDNKKTAKRK